MKIEYIAHSCFAITTDQGVRIVTDPYGDIGVPMPKLNADIVTVSHDHYDHNAVNAVNAPCVLREAGEFSLDGVRFTAIQSFHDEVCGKKRGKNLIFTMQFDGIRLCHLGDLGEDFNEALIKKIAPVDVLLIPVGGKYTINAEQAKRYVCALRPALTVPMHYLLHSSSIDVSPRGEFLSLFPRSEWEQAQGNGVIFTKEELAKQPHKIIVMEDYRSGK